MDYVGGSFILHDSGLNNIFINKEKSLNENWIDDLEQYFIDLVDAGKYIRLWLDHFYISGSTRYKKSHFYHDDAMIYGYNLTKQTFYISDNFRRGKFVSLEVPFSCNLS